MLLLYWGMDRSLTFIYAFCLPHYSIKHLMNKLLSRDIFYLIGNISTRRRGHCRSKEAARRHCTTSAVQTPTDNLFFSHFHYNTFICKFIYVALAPPM